MRSSRLSSRHKSSGSVIVLLTVLTRPRLDVGSLKANRAKRRDSSYLLVSGEVPFEYQLQDGRPSGVLNLHHVQSTDLVQDLVLIFVIFFLKSGCESGVKCDRWAGSVITLALDWGQYVPSQASGVVGSCCPWIIPLL